MLQAGCHLVEVAAVGVAAVEVAVDTTAPAVLGLVPMAAGRVVYAGEALAGPVQARALAKRRDLQLVFQDPMSALDPQMRVQAIVEEPLVVHEPGGNAAERRARRGRKRRARACATLGRWPSGSKPSPACSTILRPMRCVLRARLPRSRSARGRSWRRRLRDEDGELLADDGTAFRHCINGIENGVCNWIEPAESESLLCFGCRFNRTIPSLEKPANVARWGKFETSKKRLLFTLMSLRLPLTNGDDDPENGLLLDFIEDSRSDPERFPEAFVHTGYLGGVITINAVEADDPSREAIRVEMGESYRTLLGHLRHESGHYYWSLFDPSPEEKDEAQAMFGDFDLDYAAALETYYANGPRSDWSEWHISAYASTHPVEDWAESWGHYLHIIDVIETASEFGIAGRRDIDIRAAIEVWRDLSIALNEMNRSNGTGDAYPFVVNAAVEEKIVYVDSVVRRLRTRRRRDVATA